MLPALAIEIHDLRLRVPRPMGMSLPVTFACFCFHPCPTDASVVISWIFNAWGTADLLNASYQANRAGLLAGQLGATYFIPTLALLITHGLAYRWQI